jgi:hypothetical protein
LKLVCFIPYLSIPIRTYLVFSAGSSYYYYPHGRSKRSGHQKLKQHGYTDLDGSPELVIKSNKTSKRNSGSGNVLSKSGGGGYGELEEDEDVIFEL